MVLRTLQRPQFGLAVPQFKWRTLLKHRAPVMCPR